MSGVTVERIQKVGSQDLVSGVAFPGFGTSGSTACVGNDARLSDARTAVAHAASHNAGGGDALAIDAAAGTGSLRTLGTTATSACAGNDARVVGAVQTTRTISAGSGLSGGGDLSDNRTLAVSGLTSAHGANAVEALASPVATAAVQEVVVPFQTLSTTGSVGFVTDRKYEIVNLDARKITATGGAADTLQIAVGGVSILPSGTAFALDTKAADTFLMITLDTTKLIVASGATITFTGTAGTTDSAVRGWIRLAPVA